MPVRFHPEVECGLVQGYDGDGLVLEGVQDEGFQF
jgi:hypothetical protein